MTDKLYQCIGKGGEYKLLGEAMGAGTMRGSQVIVYQGSDGTLYFRTPLDFAERMEPITQSPKTD